MQGTNVQKIIGWWGKVIEIIIIGKNKTGK
jgi:hypothetical protein